MLFLGPRTFRKVSVAALGFGAAIVCILYVVLIPDPFYQDPLPVRILKRNRSRIEEYVESVEAGRVPLRESNQGYSVPDLLRGKGARYVEKDGDCVLITFSFLLTDPIPQLIYSPRGETGLPSMYKDNGRGLSFFEITKLDDNWFYCEWDQ